MTKKKNEIQEENLQYEEEHFSAVPKEIFDEQVKQLAKEEDQKIMDYLYKDYLFKVKTSDTDVKLRKTPSMKEVSSNIVGKMRANKTYKVINTIAYTPMPMYQLENGYYVIADHRINKINN